MKWAVDSSQPFSYNSRSTNHLPLDTRGVWPRDGFLPSPLIVSTAVAVRTQKIRIGTGILLLPLYHPVHVAEDAATLDIISNGRLILGVGMGYQAGDFGAFGIPPRPAGVTAGRGHRHH